MKILILFLLCSLFSCSFKKSMKNINNNYTDTIQQQFCILSILNIDLKYDYPKREMKLEDIADIEYIPLETRDSVLIKGIHNVAMTENIIILCDKSTNTIFLFDRQGKYISSFCHQGGGPSEYQSISNFCADFENKEIFISDYQLKYRILVYSFKGEYKRELMLNMQMWPKNLFSYDDNYLICYDSYQLNTQTNNKNEFPYSLIRKKTGEVIPIPIKISSRVSSGFATINKGRYQSYSVNIEPMIKTSNGVIISDFAKDTIFSYINKTLVPIAKRSNLVTNEDTPYLSAISIAGDKYLILNIIEKTNNKESTMIKAKSLLYNKESKELYDAEIAMGDFIGSKGMSWDSYRMDIPNNYIIRILRTDLLLNLLDKKRLGGKLKDIASKLQDDANPVLMIAKFKE